MFDEYGFPRDPDLDATAPTMYTFVYCSRAAEGVDDAAVNRLIEAAQRYNLTCGITGVLVFGSGVFFQWIEGPAAEVRKLMASLHGDPRHFDIVSLDQSEESASVFIRIGRWSGSALTTSAKCSSTRSKAPKTRTISHH